MDTSTKRSTLTWVFNPGTKIKFSHLEYEDNVTDWQGTQIPFIGFVELTHFTKHQFLVDGEQTTQIKLSSKLYDIRRLISEDLRAIKKKNVDMDNKKQINSKDEQKIILGGGSPDFGYAASMRAFFEVNVQPEPMMRWL